MGTIQCASCGAEVDAESTACPTCGADPRSGQRGRFTADVAPAPAPQRAGPPYVPRHTIRRGIATVVDWALVFVAALAVWSSTVHMSQDRYSGRSPLWGFLALPAILAGLLFVYGSALESMRGATLGKLLVGVRARMLDGARCTVRSAVLRNVSKAVVGAAAVMLAFGVALFVSWLRARGTFGAWTPYWSRLMGLLLAGPAGLLATFFFMMTSPLRQRLGDRLSGTVVVRRRAACPAPAETAGPAIVHGQVALPEDS
jgi:uncharacterized RDD family membrane protein YckC